MLAAGPAGPPAAPRDESRLEAEEGFDDQRDDAEGGEGDRDVPGRQDDAGEDAAQALAGASDEFLLWPQSGGAKSVQ